MDLSQLTRPELIFPRLPGSDAPTLLRSFADRLAVEIESSDPETLFQKLLEREQLGSTGIGSGVAIPHCKVKGLARPVMAVGVTRDGIDFGAVDGQPVRVFFVLVSPQESPAEHLRVLAAVSRWLKADRHVEKVLKGKEPEAIYSLLRDGAGP